MRNVSLSVLPLVIAITGCGAGNYMPASAPPQSRMEAADVATLPMPGAQPTPAAYAAGAQNAPAFPVTPVVASSATPSAQRPTTPAATSTAASTKATVSNLYIIYAGALRLSVAPKTESNTLEKAIGVAFDLGGHLVKLERASVVLKVPSASFRDAMHTIATLGEVTNEEIHAADVTDEFRDLEVRLQNLRATRSRIEEFLKRAQQMSDTLTVEKELERVAMEIDRIQGRLHLLRERSAMSEITLTVSAPIERAAPAVVVKEGQRLAPVTIPVEWLQSVGLANLLNVQGF